MSHRRCACPWAPRFFGLTPDDKEFYLEQIFILMYYMGFLYKEAYHLPVWQRVWFIQRINREFKEANDRNSNASRAAHDNTPDQRALEGLSRESPPARLRRFT